MTERDKVSQKTFPKRWEPIIYRPNVPEGWYVQEQNDGIESNYISFVKFCKIHHNAKPEKLYVIFHEFAPGTEKYLFTIRGGRHAKPDESMKYFTDIKSAEAYLIYVMESTDRWIEEINSEKYIKEYNDRIAKLVAADEKRAEDFRRMLDTETL